MTESISAALTAELPSTWTSAPLGMVAHIINGGTPTGDEKYWNGEIPFVTPPDLRGVDGAQLGPTGRTLTFEGVSAGSTLVEGGIVVSSRAPIGYVGRLAQPSAFNQGCKVVRAASADERFLAYVLIATRPLMQELGQGTTFMELSADALGTLRVPLPSVIEQQRIADYLDHETATIDTLIERQQMLVKRLIERRAVVVRDYLETGGRMVDPVAGTVVLEDSSWRISPAKHICKIKTGVEDSGNAVPHGPYPFYVRGSRVLRAEDWAFEGPAVLTPGDGQGGTGKVFHYAEGRFQAHQRVYVLHNFQRVSAAYFYHWLSSFLREIALASSYTVTMESLRQPVLESLSVFFPADLLEQARIVAAIEAETAKIDALIAKAERFIELARERRAALITAAVTGQISVD